MIERKDQGKLIVFEGIDGSGKTTQTKRVTSELNGKGLSVVTFKEPTEGPYGSQLRWIMNHGRQGITPQEELDLFINDRIEDVQNNILPALNKNFIVIMDRYYFSNLAYQGALGIDVNTIKTLNEQIAPRPDMVIILDLDAQIGIHRINTLRGEIENHFEKKAYLEKVNHIFNQMVGDNIYHIKSSLPLEEINSQIDQLIQNVFRIIPLVIPKNKETHKK